MEKAQIELFRAIRSGDLAKAQKAYDKGANVNWPLDRWMEHGHQHWGLRVQVKPLGIYLGFSARESWRVPDGEGADRGDTLLMVALKCRKQDEAVFLLGCDRLNRNCLNEAGNSAADIARATGQEFLLRGQWGGANLPPPAPQQQQQQMGEFEEARPAWEREGAGAAAAGGTGAVQYASVVAEAVPVGGKGEAGTVYATAEPVGGLYSHPTTGHATAAEVAMATPFNPNNNNSVGSAGQQQRVGGRAPRPNTGGGLGTGAFGAF
ncbi:unnamed protein product [Pylaiella littoralis]